MNDHYPVRSAFSLLNQVLDEYLKNFGESWKTVQADNTQPWPYLSEAVTKFQDPAEADKLLRIQQELDETKIILMGLFFECTSNLESQSHASMTLREESTGKTRGNVNAKTMCKIDHLKNLALWAATDASVPSLGAFFGQRLAASIESVGIRSDPNLFVCQRCESILQPGHNCTIRIEKNKQNKVHSRNKSKNDAQNSVIYKCHFCSHQNLMRGTPKGYFNEIYPPKAKPPSKSLPAKKVIGTSTGCAEATTVANAKTVDRQSLETSSFATPLSTGGLYLLDAKRRKRNRSGTKKVSEPQSCSAAADAEESACTSSKRRRNSWKSLKEIAQSTGLDSAKKFSNLAIPFFI